MQACPNETVLFQFTVAGEILRAHRSYYDSQASISGIGFKICGSDFYGTIQSALEEKYSQGVYTSPVTGVPLRYKARKSLLFTKHPSVDKIKKHFVDKVNTVLFYLTLLGCFYAVAKHTSNFYLVNLLVKIIFSRENKSTSVLLGSLMNSILRVLLRAQGPRY